MIWGDFCPYVHTGDNSGLYRHPHLALAALELWIANQCMPDKCASTWLDSPNGQGYGADNAKATSITWCEMDNNTFSIAQPAVPYVWPNSGEGIYPGHDMLYVGEPNKPVPGLYVTEFVDLQEGSTDEGGAAEDEGSSTSGASFSVFSGSAILATVVGIAGGIVVAL